MSDENEVEWPTQTGAVFTVTREQLHARVWTDPMMTLAARLNISGNALAKTCKAHHIPVPPKGYWAMKVAGKRVKVVPLPPLPAGVSDRIRLRVAPPAPPPVAFPELPPVPTVHIESHPVRRHPLVKAAMTALRGKKVDEHGAVHANVGMLEIRIAPEAIDRALTITDALIKALEERGHTPYPENRGNAAASVFGARVPLVLYQTIRRVLHRETAEEKAEKDAEIRRIIKRERISEIDARLRFAWAPRLYDFFPSADLVLKIDGWVQSAPRKSWKDSPRQKLELKLGDIIGGIEQYASCSNREDEQRAIEAAHRAEEARKREEARLRALAEQRRREELLTEAGAADTARQIRQFVGAVQAATSFESTDLSEWATWALTVADSLDPVLSRLSKLLKHPNSA